MTEKQETHFACFQHQFSIGYDIHTASAAGISHYRSIQTTQKQRKIKTNDKTYVCLSMNAAQTNILTHNSVFLPLRREPSNPS